MSSPAQQMLASTSPKTFAVAESAAKTKMNNIASMTFSGQEKVNRHQHVCDRHCKRMECRSNDFVCSAQPYFCNQTVFENKISHVVRCLIAVKQQYLKIKIDYICPITSSCVFASKHIARVTLTLTRSAALSVGLLFSAQRCCADTLSLIVMTSHQINDLTFNESLDCRYCNDIAYCEQLQQ